MGSAPTRSKTGARLKLPSTLAELEDCCQLLADTPGLGRACDDILPGVFRREQGKHVVFFRRTASGIRVLRFLHGRMLPEHHLLEDDDE